MASDVVPSSSARDPICRPSGPGEASSRPRVLLIDGLPDRLAPFAEALRAGGFEVTVLTASPGGIPLAELAAAHLVLLTTADPARAGVLLRTCRAAGSPELPVLVASAASVTRDPHLLHAGADVIVSSAVGPGALVETARALLEGEIPPAAAPPASVGRS